MSLVDPGEKKVSCQEAIAAVYEYLDGELESASSDQVRAHFDACARCYPHLRLEEAFRAALRRAAGGEEAPQALKERLRTLLDEADRG